MLLLAVAVAMGIDGIVSVTVMANTWLLAVYCLLSEQQCCCCLVVKVACVPLVACTTEAAGW